MARSVRGRLILRLWGRRWCEGMELWCEGRGELLVFYSMLSINMPRMTRVIPMNWVVEIFSL